MGLLWIILLAAVTGLGGADGAGGLSGIFDTILGLFGSVTGA